MEKVLKIILSYNLVVTSICHYPNITSSAIISGSSDGSVVKTNINSNVQLQSYFGKDTLQDKYSTLTQENSPISSLHADYTSKDLLITAKLGLARLINLN